MARDDSDDIRIRPGRFRRAGTRADPRELPFTRQVELAVRRGGGQPGRIGRGGAGRKGGGSGRFDAHGRGAKAVASFPRDGGSWQHDSIGRFRSWRVVVKARVVKLAPQRGSRGPKVRGASRAADEHLRYLERDGVTRDGERGRAYPPSRTRRTGAPSSISGATTAIRPGRSQGARTRGNPRDLPFTRQVELAVRRAGGNPDRIGGHRGSS